MSRHENQPEGMAFAKFYSRVTRALKRIPWVDRAIVGDNVLPEGWDVLNMSPEDVEAVPWVKFDRDPKGFRLPFPRFYRRAGMLAIQAAEMRELRARNPGSHDAVAVKFGKVAVGATLAPNLQFGLDPEEPTLLLVAARVSRDDLYIAPGVRDGITGEFKPIASIATSLDSSADMNTLPIRDVANDVVMV